MFLYYFSHIERPYAELEPIFSDGLAGWLPGLLEGTDEQRDATRATLSVGKRLRFSKQMDVFVGSANRGQAATTLPIRIEAAGPSSLFPRLEADLELAPVGSDLTQLSLRGSYRPPLGVVGELIDQKLLHRVAEAAIKDLVEQIAGKLLQHNATAYGVSWTD